MHPSTIRIGVIGYGYWGPNLVRNFAEVRGCQVVAVSDSRAERRALVQSRYPAIDTTGDFHELIADPNVDAVYISTTVLLELGRRGVAPGAPMAPAVPSGMQGQSMRPSAPASSPPNL